MKRTDKNTGLEWFVNILFQLCVVIVVLLITGVMVNTVFGLGVTVQEVFWVGLLLWFSVRAWLLYI